jgi:hypothetical protein
MATTYWRTAADKDMCVPCRAEPIRNADCVFSLHSYAAIVPVAAICQANFIRKLGNFYNGSELLFFAQSFSDKRANPLVVSSAQPVASERS